MSASFASFPDGCTTGRPSARNEPLELYDKSAGFPLVYARRLTKLFSSSFDVAGTAGVGSG